MPATPFTSQSPIAGETTTPPRHSSTKESVIHVDDISKLYRLGEVGTGSLAHDVNRWWFRVRGKEDPYLRIGETNVRSSKGSTDYVWALRNISFDVKRGEVLGIIGRNGAGKSTLLKILSRVTAPTEGCIRIKGRVASLLEVGTGFHPELTGRENIFLNGAILGMRKHEIANKLDGIVDFSGVERYLDTPVKRYSSGMYVRLAFAVAAHLDPDIMVVDEVLAVGDASFQKKCLGKMNDVASDGGRSILFVSHNMGSIRSLAARCVYLDNGTVRAVGDTASVLDQYARDLAESDSTDHGAGERSRIVRAAMVDSAGNELNVHNGAPLTCLDVEIETDGTPSLIFECLLTDASGAKLGLSSPGHFSKWRLPTEPGRYRIHFPMKIPPLASGTYYFDLMTTLEGNVYDHYVTGAVSFTVHSPTMRAAEWDYRAEFNAGHFVMDADELPTITGIQ